MPTINSATKIAVFLDQEIQTGGGFQQSMNIIDMLRALPNDLVELIYVTNKKENIAVLNRYFDINPVFVSTGIFQRTRLKLRKMVKDRYLARIVRKIFGFNSFESVFRKHEVDLVYFTSPSRYSLCLENTNFIYTVFDMCHRDHPEFPEVRDFCEFERREYLYRSSILKSVATIVDSKISKDRAVSRYGIDEERVVVIPFSPSQAVSKKDISETQINIREKYNIHGDYIFYPAQYWSHKNHVYLIMGIKELEKRYGIKVSLVFSGSDKGSRTGIEALTGKLNLQDRVLHTGFVPDDEIPLLYKSSLALVMPSYFGPTNIPPLEAFALGVPVLYSDLKGQREQVGDAALLIDLTDPGSLADKVHALVNEPDLRTELEAKGKKRLDELKQASEEVKLAELIKGFAWKNKTWERH